MLVLTCMQKPHLHLITAYPVTGICQLFFSNCWRSIFPLYHRRGQKCSFDSATIESSWNVMAHGDARAGKWRGNWWMEWVASTLDTTLEHDVSNITTVDTQAVSSRFKGTCPFCRKTISGFWVCAITFQT